MPIAVFGSKVFEVRSDRLYTFGEFKYASSLETEKQDTAGSKPSTYNKGPGLSSIAMKLRLDVTQGVNPRTELEAWEAIKDKATAYPFMLGRRPLGRYKWLLVDIQFDNTIIDNAGNLIAADLALKFDEYVRPGSKAASKGGEKKAPGINQAKVAAQVGLADKSEYKRGSVLTQEE